MRRDFQCLVMLIVIGAVVPLQIRASDNGHPSSLPSNLPRTELKFEYTGPDPNSPESAEVFDTFKELTKAYVKGDLTTCANYIDDESTAFEEGTNKILVGKEAVISELGRVMKLNSQREAPLVLYTIKQPFAKVIGNTATVTYVAVKAFGGERPCQYESYSSEIYMKRGDKWKRMHYGSYWKPVQ